MWVSGAPKDAVHSTTDQAEERPISTHPYITAKIASERRRQLFSEADRNRRIRSARSGLDEDEIGPPPAAGSGATTSPPPAPAPNRFHHQVGTVDVSNRATGRCYALVEIRGSDHAQTVLYVHGCGTEGTTLSKVAPFWTRTKPPPKRIRYFLFLWP